VQQVIATLRRQRCRLLASHRMGAFEKFAEHKRVDVPTSTNETNHREESCAYVAKNVRFLGLVSVN
jgi:hypothetical protein